MHGGRRDGAAGSARGSSRGADYHSSGRFQQPSESNRLDHGPTRRRSPASRSPISLRSRPTRKPLTPPRQSPGFVGRPQLRARVRADSADVHRPSRGQGDRGLSYYDPWRELNADGVVVGTVQKTDTGVRVQVRLFNVQSRQSALGKDRRYRLRTHACTPTRWRTIFTRPSARSRASRRRS